MYTTFISPAELSSHLDDPLWRIIDCRFDLANPAWGEQDYQRAHIPGAVFADLNRDLSAPITPTSGRHPLPAPQDFIALLKRLGVSENTQVVVVDTVAGAFAARLWWMLRYYGHSAVAVLEGGLSNWQRQGYPLSSGSESCPPGQFHGEPQPNWMVTTAELDVLRHDPRYRIIDARAAERYRGESEPIDAIAGHIPGAVNRPHLQNLARAGLLLPAETLRQQFLELLGDIPPQNAIVYCGSGVTSCFHILAMHHAGLHGARLYVGSWSEWIRDPQRPIATGPQPG